MPEAKANPAAPPSSSARTLSTTTRVGFAVRE